MKTNKQITNNSRYETDRPPAARPCCLLDNNFPNEICQSTVSQHYYSKCNVKSSDSCVKCVDNDQLHVFPFLDCVTNDSEVTFHDMHSNGNVYPCVQKAFDTAFDKSVANDTIPDPLYKVYDSHMYQYQRQTNVPCYAYFVAPLQVCYLYGAYGCISQLVLKHIGDSIDDMPRGLCLKKQHLELRRPSDPRQSKRIQRCSGSS